MPRRGTSPVAAASESAANTSRYSGSPTAPGSLVRSSTAIARVVDGRAASNAAAGKGRYKRIVMSPTFSPAAIRASTVSVAAPAADPSARSPVRRRARRCSRRVRSGVRCARRAHRRPPRRCPARRRRTGLPPLGPGRTRRGSAPCRGRPALGVIPRAGGRRRRRSPTSSAEIVVVEQLDLADLVARAEAVEEVEERHPRSSVAA